VKRLLPVHALPGVALAAMSASFAAGDAEGWPSLAQATAFVGVVLVWSVAVEIRRRYPERPLWKLLGVLSLLYALQPLIYSTDPVLFALARAARPAAEVLLIWVMLAFPSGRLTGRVERWLLALAWAAILLLWLPGMMLTPRFPPFGPLASCEACPANMIAVADHPAWSAGLLQAFRVVGVGVLLATCVVLILRLHRASDLMRRALAPVALASIARTLSIAIFLASGAGSIALTITLWAVPLAVALGLLRGRLYTARALQQVVSGLRRRLSISELRELMAEALEDRSLQLGTWDPRLGIWIDGAGAVLRLP
jgi:hypothetical protein